MCGVIYTCIQSYKYALYAKYTCMYMNETSELSKHEKGQNYEVYKYIQSLCMYAVHLYITECFI